MAILLIAGILCTEYIEYAAVIFYASLIIGGISFFIPNAKNSAVIFMLICIFFCGALIARPAQLNISGSGTYHFNGKCEEVLKYNSYIISVKDIRFHLNAKDQDISIQTGDSISFHSKIYPVRDQETFGAFSYDRYLKQKDVHYKAYPTDTIILKGRSENLSSFFQSIRNRLVAKANFLLPDTTVASVVSALCLGYRDDLDNETQELFTTTGTIHLLSVSGLHTGAIYLLLLGLLNLSGLSDRKYRLLLIPLLWLYACITGLSPSVVRAATILSFIICGEIFQRDYTPINAIAASAFFTLIVNPLALYSVSFQMSYSAYSGIVIIYPLLYRHPNKLPFIVDKAYSLLCLSIAAQILTLPLITYYFHTFSLNSFLINIIAVPVATLLLYAGTILLFLPAAIGIYFAAIPEQLYQLLSALLHLFCHINISLEHLYPSGLHLLLLYCCLLSLFLYFTRKEKIHLSLITLFLLLTYSCLFNYRASRQKALILFHQYDQSCIILNYNGHYSLLKGAPDLPEKTMAYIRINELRPLSRHSGLFSRELNYNCNRLQTRAQTIYIADRTHTHYRNDSILIVTGQVYPEQLFTPEFKQYPRQIIIDGSSNRFVMRKWENFCQQANISLNTTYENGYVTILLK